MKEDLLKQLLESILGKSKSARGGDEAVFYCPSCNHHKKKLHLIYYHKNFNVGFVVIKGIELINYLKKLKHQHLFTQP